MSGADDEVLVQVRDGLGQLTLNRPRSINALTGSMIASILAALGSWRGDPAIRAVVIDGAGERGLCAGGDIRAIYDSAQSGGRAAEQFWRDEYRMNATIARYPKPVVSFMDGLVMGGGVGVSAHASHRIVGEGSSVAMPEVGIGFSPDAGGTRLLARAPGQVGLHLALTGRRMSAPDAIYSGFADAFIPVADRGELIRLIASGGPDAAIKALAQSLPTSALSADRDWIDACYGAPTVAQIIERLESRAEPAAREAAAVIAGQSPISACVALRAVRDARDDASLEDSLRREFRVSMRALTDGDFLEGIRAQVIDRDRTPRWRPSRLRDVNDAELDAYFAPRPDDLQLDRHSTIEGAQR